MAKCVENDLLKELDKSPYLGVMLDETCDITIEKKLAVYARYTQETGKVRTSFLGNKRIMNSTAAGSKDAFCEFLIEKGLVKGNACVDLQFLVNESHDSSHS